MDALPRDFYMKKDEIATIGIFSTIYAIIRVVPLFPIIGTQASFPLSDVLVPLLGMILEPKIAFLSITLGTFISFVLGKPPIFLGLDFAPAALAAFCVGKTLKNEKLQPSLLFLLAILFYFIYPNSLPFIEVSSIPIPYMYLHIVALLLIIFYPFNKFIYSVKRRQVLISVFLLVFACTMIQHAIGTDIFLVVFGNVLGKISSEAWPIIWKTCFYLYHIERIAISSLSFLITIPTLAILRKRKLR